MEIEFQYNKRIWITGSERKYKIKLTGKDIKLRYKNNKEIK